VKSRKSGPKGESERRKGGPRDEKGTNLGGLFTGGEKLGKNRGSGLQRGQFMSHKIRKKKIFRVLGDS